MTTPRSAFPGLSEIRTGAAAIGLSAKNTLGATGTNTSAAVYRGARSEHDLSEPLGRPVFISHST